MRGFLQHLRSTLRLYGRNKMALFYSYLFPAIFLVAFAVLYRSDPRPLAAHMGELLTVAVLGGACFGLPTGLVSERERGVWRRFRLTPIPTRSLIASTAVARYLSLLTAGLLQVALAIGVAAVILAQRPPRPGTTMADFLPIPGHPLELFVAFTFVAFAFIGLGLVIAMMADNVPAVQALGQCIFLPMLILGGVAVKLYQLPDSVQHLSAFLPGRYAVEAVQACVTGEGLRQVPFSLVALFVIGSAGCMAGAKMFRWDAQQRFVERGGKGWMTAALAAWVLVGIVAEYRQRIGPILFGDVEAPTKTAPVAPRPKGPGTKFNDSVPAPGDAAPGASTTPSGANAGGSSAAGAGPSGQPRPKPASWRDVTEADIDALAWDAPPDQGVVAPMARITDDPGPTVLPWIEDVRELLSGWPPAKEPDPVQRVRNLLYVAAAPDVLQIEIEPYLPHIVLSRLRQDFDEKDLSKLLCWIALHPGEGDLKAAEELQDAGIEFQLTQPLLLRQRTYFYAQKLLARTAGKIKEE